MHFKFTAVQAAVYLKMHILFMNLLKTNLYLRDKFSNCFTLLIPPVGVFFIVQAFDLYVGAFFQKIIESSAG